MWRLFHFRVARIVENATRRHLCKVLDRDLIISDISAVKDSDAICQKCSKKPKTILVWVACRSRGKQDSLLKYHCCRICGDIKELPTAQNAKR